MERRPICLFCCSSRRLPLSRQLIRYSSSSSSSSSSSRTRTSRTRPAKDNPQPDSPAISSHENHLNSILNHPLFRLSSSPQSTSKRTSNPHSISALTNQSPQTNRSKEKEEGKDPLSHLDSLIASGRADYPALRRCLSELRISPHTDSSASASDSASRAIATITAWYDSATWSDRINALYHMPLTGTVMEYIVVAGREDIVIRWLADCFDETDLIGRWGGGRAQPSTTTTTSRDDNSQLSNGSSISDSKRWDFNRVSESLPERKECVLNLLIGYIRALLLYGKGGSGGGTSAVESSIDFLSRACVMFSTTSSSLTSPSPPPSTSPSPDSTSTTIYNTTFIPFQTRPSPFRRAAIFIATHVVLSSSSPPTLQISEKSFEKLSGICNNLLGPRHFWNCMLPLHNPARPDVTAAMEYGVNHFERELEYFRESVIPAETGMHDHDPLSSIIWRTRPPDTKPLKQQQQRQRSRQTERKRNFLQRMCLSATEICLQQGKYQEAGFFVKYALAFAGPVESQFSGSSSSWKSGFAVDGEDVLWHSHRSRPRLLNQDQTKEKETEDGDNAGKGKMAMLMDKVFPPHSRATGYLDR